VGLNRETHAGAITHERREIEAQSLWFGLFLPDQRKRQQKDLQHPNESHRNSSPSDHVSASPIRAAHTLALT
jgi:hypothetical protein